MDRRDGKGEDVKPDGSKYVGDFKDDKMHGKGTFTWATGGSYTGTW